MGKVCFKCKRSKDISEFYTHPRMADGHLNKCKECTKKDSIDHYADSRESCLKYERQRAKDLSRKKMVLEYQKKRRRLYPEKDKANVKCLDY